MTGPKQRSGQPSVEIDFVAIYYALREQTGLLVACLILGLVAAGLYLAWAPRIYRAQAIIQIEQAERRVVKIEDLDEQNLESLEALKTLEMNLSNWTLLARVARNARLDLTPEALGLPERKAKPYTEEELLAKLGKSIFVQLMRGTRLITIEAEAADPKIAGLLPEIIVEEYKKLSFEEHVAMGREASNFLRGEVETLRAKLERSKQALQNYRESTKAVALEDSRNTVDASLRELNQKLTEAKTERLRIESDQAQLQSLDRNRAESFLNLSSIANAPSVLEQKKLVTAQEADLANRSQRYLPKHPRYIESRTRLDELRAGLSRAILMASEGVSRSLSAAEATEKKIEKAVREQEQKSLELSRTLIGYEALQREVESDMTLYESVLARMKETDVMRGIKSEVVRVVQPSTAPGGPSKPRRKLVLGAGLAGGILVGLSLAFMRIILDRTLKTVDQVEDFLDLNVLGSVPRRSSRGGGKGPLPMIDEPHGAIAESFRTLRTLLALRGEVGARRSFLFTSAVPGEGKSFCASNFAVSMAQQGMRTLLLDADLRLPSLQDIFFDKKSHSGVADVLAGQTPFASAWQESGTANLCVMTAGNRPHHSAELLVGPRFGQLLQEALKTFDCVVLDTAPVNAVSDTLLLVKLVQSVCIVVHSTHTPRNAVARARGKMTDAGAPIAGVVLNFLPQASGRDYHYHYSHGAYGAGVYGAPESSR